MSRPPALQLGAIPKPQRQLYHHCAVQGCDRTPRAFSRFCTQHAMMYFRTRDPNGRTIRAHELKVHRELAAFYLQRYIHHPAVVAALQFIASTLTNTLLPAAIRKQLQRLHLDGATPQSMLTEFLAVLGLEHYLPHSVNSDACWAYNTGNRVLRTTPLPDLGKGHRSYIPARVSEEYGWILRRTLGAFGFQLWHHIQSETEAPDRSARTLSAALREAPFGAPAVPSLSTEQEP